MSGGITNMTAASGGMNLIGVNIAGGEFGSNVPGVLGTDYIYPSTQEIDYYASQGMTVIRVPFLIERLENSPGGPLSAQDLQQLQSIVAYAATKGVDVILDPHNYGDAWGQEILPGNTTEQEYDKFMSQFAASFKSDPNVIFGLMNQPNQQTPTQQAQIDNDAIAAIRGAGATQELLVPGTDWDGGWTWVSSGNAAAINPSTIVDPDHNYAIEVHQYLDSDGSGTNFSPITDPNIGPERLTAVTQWAEANGVKLFLGETGVPSDSESLTALQNELSYMEQNSSVWQGLAYWAGGAWWGSYPMSIEPSGLGTGTVTNAPQMNILKQFAPGGGGSTGTGGSTGGGGTSFTPSPNDTVITPGSGSITDASGNVWTVTTGQVIEENGHEAGTNYNMENAAYVNGNIYGESDNQGSSGVWFEWNGSGWNSIGTISPLPGGGGSTGTGGSTGGGGTSFTPSPNDTVITPGSGSITDASGNVWTVTTGQVIEENGHEAGTNYNMENAAYVNGNIYGESDNKGSSGVWFEWNGSGWNSIGTTSPLPGSDPPSSGLYPAIINGTGPDSIVLHMSENAWANGDSISDANGDAEFTVLVNGVQQGGTYTAVAPHATSDDITVSDNPGEQTFAFSGTFGVNPTLTVNFINEANGGTPQTDRNLYLDSATYDVVAQNDIGQAGTMLADGSYNFDLIGGTFTDPATTASSSNPSGGTGTGPATFAIDQPGNDSTNYIQFIGGSTPGTRVIYDSPSMAPAPPTNAAPIEYDISASMTGTMTISDFRESVDSLGFASGVSVVSENFTNSGGLMLNLSNQGHVLLAASSQA
jgi:hypothetical protein